MHDSGWEAWHDFFLLTGTAGVTLTGLLFVVVSFGAQVIAERSESGVRAFVTPNVYHLTAAFAASAALLGPGLSRHAIGTALSAGALASMAYLLYTRAHRHWRVNRLTRADWVWYVGLPWIAYLLCLLAGIGVLLDWPLSQPLVAVVVVVLLIAGIRNAWDLILWMTQQMRSEKSRP